MDVSGNVFTPEEQQTLDSYEARLNQAKNELVSVQLEHDRFQRHIASRQQELDRLNTEINGQSSMVNILAERINGLEVKEANLREEVAKRTSEHNDIQTRLSSDRKEWQEEAAIFTAQKEESLRNKTEADQLLANARLISADVERKKNDISAVLAIAEQFRNAVSRIDQ